MSNLDPRSPPSSASATVQLAMKKEFHSDLDLGAKVVSTKKFYSAVMRAVARAMLGKGFPKHVINFSSTQKKIEIKLRKCRGWVAEIVPCVMVDKKGDLYCCKSYFISCGENVEEEKMGGDKEVNKLDENNNASDKIKYTPRKVLTEEEQDVVNLDLRDVGTADDSSDSETETSRIRQQSENLRPIMKKNNKHMKDTAGGRSNEISEPLTDMNSSNKNNVNSNDDLQPVHEKSSEKPSVSNEEKENLQNTQDQSTLLDSSKTNKLEVKPVPAKQEATEPSSAPEMVQADDQTWFPVAPAREVGTGGVKSHVYELLDWQNFRIQQFNYLLIRYLTFVTFQIGAYAGYIPMSP